MSVKLDKTKFRKDAKIGLTNVVKRQAKCVHYSVLNELLELIDIVKARRILLYMPLSYEVDVCRVRRNLVKKCEIFVPFMQGVSLKMVRLRQPFFVSNFNVREPRGKKLSGERLDMAVVPVIGVDRTMARIGHGKGFYDRFFAQLAHKPKMIVFLQIKDYYTDQILSEEHDVRGDIYITPSNIYIKKEKQRDRDNNKYRHSRSGSLGWTHVFKAYKRRKLRRVFGAGKDKG